MAIWPNWLIWKDIREDSRSIFDLCSLFYALKKNKFKHRYLDKIVVSNSVHHHFEISFVNWFRNIHFVELSMTHPIDFHLVGWRTKLTCAPYDVLFFLSLLLDDCNAILFIISHSNRLDCLHWQTTFDLFLSSSHQSISMYIRSTDFRRLLLLWKWSWNSYIFSNHWRNRSIVLSSSIRPWCDCRYQHHLGSSSDRRMHSSELARKSCTTYFQTTLWINFSG